MLLQVQVANRNLVAVLTQATLTFTQATLMDWAVVSLYCAALHVR